MDRTPGEQETVRQTCKEWAPVVRVRSDDELDASVLFDNGSTGIVYPDINTADEAGGYPFFIAKFH